MHWDVVLVTWQRLNWWCHMLCLSSGVMKSPPAIQYPGVEMLLHSCKFRIKPSVVQNPCSPPFFQFCCFVYSLCLLYKLKAERIQAPESRICSCSYSMSWWNTHWISCSPTLFSLVILIFGDLTFYDDWESKMVETSSFFSFILLLPFFLYDCSSTRWIWGLILGIRWSLESSVSWSHM